ncbi:hypothetical protein SDC9_181443 [bioreactor metagenome]|uniref:Uncharacterized protein n=1 Tax=bioreactor metagenome TaxID=1076179 RepID=A0A645H4K9_9ZZZZ
MFFGVLPDFKGIVGASSTLAALIVREQVVHQSLIQRQLTTIICDKQHVVN